MNNTGNSTIQFRKVNICGHMSGFNASGIVMSTNSCNGRSLSYVISF